MTPDEHKNRAEALLDEGVEVVKNISRLNDIRVKLGEKYIDPNRLNALEALTEKMDEYGKKAMGIWAQAQVHATLATGRSEI